MWFIIKYILLSISAIVIIHYLMQYLKDTFAIKKVKHLSSEIEKYKQIIHEIQPNIMNQYQSLTYLPPPTTIPATFPSSTQLTIVSNPDQSENPYMTPPSAFFTENTKSELMNDLDSFLTSNVTTMPISSEYPYVRNNNDTNDTTDPLDALTKYNTQNNINISFESI